MIYAIDSESIRAYRNLVMVYANDLWREKDPEKRVTLVTYLSDAVTTLARMEIEEAKKIKER
ncbi:hypothetical protein NG799_28685 [Laspinema sp. D1]|uniref:Uncharacterized protein n=1 Tax=Laspinema palackyanum D2a TaxID=2953684 RepID=A0ABT2MZV8_9CYAN|nr:hypothetical protein [Laspinema sp. D2a]